MKIKRIIMGVLLFLFSSSIIAGIASDVFHIESIYGYPVYSICVLIAGILIGSGVSK